MKTCRDVHRLVIERQDRLLPWGDRIAVRVHLLMCSACRCFERQMVLLREALRRLPDA